MNKLEKLLYRKKSTEKLMSIWKIGITMYSEFIDAIKEKSKDDSIDKLTSLKMQKEAHEADIHLKHYITSFKAAEREYFHYLIPEIEKVATEDEQKKIEFLSIEKVMGDLAEIEIFGSHSKQPDNVELVAVSKDIEQHIQLLKEMIEAASDRVGKVDDPVDKAWINLEIFKLNLQLATNMKRLSERNDYYFNTFKPKFDEEMIEADLYLEKYLERAEDLVKLGVDVKLQFLLDEYKKNKSDKEKVWLFYTALKARLHRIFNEMIKNKSSFKGKMHLSEPIICKK